MIKFIKNDALTAIRKNSLIQRGGEILKNGIKTLAMWLIIIVIFLVVLSSIVENSNSKLKYSELISNINSNNVKSIVINSDGKTAEVELKDDNVKKETSIPDMGAFISYTEEFLNNGNFTLEEKPESILVAFIPLITPFVILVVFMLFWFLTIGGANS